MANKITDMSKIEKLQSLKNKNIISDEEFIRLKTKIIDSNMDCEVENDDTSAINENTKSYSNYVNPNLKYEKPSLIKGLLIVSGVIVISILILNTCNNNSNSDFKDSASEIAVDTSVTNYDTLNETIEIKENTLKNFTYEDVARYAIASILQVPVRIIKSHKKGNYYHVNYISLSDSEKIECKVKFEGNKIVWGDLNGRWQDTELDEKISFEEKDNKLNIINTYSDGSQGIQEFKKGD